MKPRLGVLSLGCPRNLVDSEVILSRLVNKGYTIADLAQAQVVLVNTCAFIKEAKEESIEAILDLIELKKQGRLRKIIIYGCLSQRYKDRLVKDLPQIDAFIGRLNPDKGVERFPLTLKHYAYLKISEGCVNRCSFCIIPKIKGRLKSLPLDSISRKVREFSKAGISELNIIGQDITSYGIDLKPSVRLTAIIKNILKEAKRIKWVRLLYLNPDRLDDDLLKLFRDEEKICKYIDLPVQHINNRLLKLMHRKTSGKDIVSLINKVRKFIPDVAIRTSLIVGFPGETDKEFAELLMFIKDTKFERLGVFKYSREEGTSAYNLPGQVPERVKEDRFNQVMSCQQDISRQINGRFIGKALQVLVDESQDEGYLGRTQFDAPEVDGSVYIKSKRTLSPGDFVNIKVTDTLEYDLVGEVDNESCQ
ncbi:MAG: 30S ribosomal protein S12 methylthiotransferase RimO [Candidatus Omnitrophica bacterium]|nr:30S ribosomal protein S12 methylthiotransferase RimO [Candidatus Omnitrophota bacterium]